MAIALVVNTLVEINVSEIIWFSLETPERRWRIIRPIRLGGHILCVSPGQLPIGFSVKPGLCRISTRCRALLLGEMSGIIGLRAVVSRCRFIRCHPVAPGLLNSLIQKSCFLSLKSGSVCSLSLVSKIVESLGGGAGKASPRMPVSRRTWAFGCQE